MYSCLPFPAHLLPPKIAFGDVIELFLHFHLAKGATLQSKIIPLSSMIAG